MDRGGIIMKRWHHEDIFTLIEKWAPKHLAYDWDNVGLQIGSTQSETNKVMITLDVVEAVVDEAIEKGVNLIIAHHPLLFKPLKTIDYNSFKGKVIQKLIKHDITVYAAHTNLDIAHGGVNDLLSDALQLQNKSHLVKTAEISLYKLIVYVPVSHVEEVRQAIGNNGYGHIGDYSHCSFNTEGTGTFKPLEGTNPFIGEKDTIAYVDETKIETIVKENDLQSALNVVKKHHPYEEVAYDVYKLEQTGDTFGLGIVGKLQETITLKNLCDKVKQAFHLDKVRLTGNQENTVKKVAIVGGSGESFIVQAKNKGADVLITGDITFHQAQDAEEMGIAVIDAGHYIEEIMKKATKDYINHLCNEVECITSEIDTNPFRYV